MLHTTFRLLREHTRGIIAREDRWELFRREAKKLGYEGDDTPIPLTVALDSVGLNDTLWALRTVLPEEEAARDKLARLVACDYAERVAHLWVAPPDETWVPMDAIAVSRRYANGQATRDELRKAEAVAGAAWEEAARAAWAAWEGWGEAREAARAEHDWQANRLREYLVRPPSGPAGEGDV